MSELSIEIDKNIADVWNHIADIKSHVLWMKDAVSIEKMSGADNSVGALYVCDTKVGPLRTRDHMQVTAYEAPTLMEMEHTGAVKGKGTFRLVATSDTKTLFIWAENLKFPWYMGGAIGKIVGMKMLHKIWKQNLEQLKTDIEKGPEGPLSNN